MSEENNTDETDEERLKQLLMGLLEDMMDACYDSLRRADAEALPSHEIELFAEVGFDWDYCWQCEMR